MNIVDIYKSNHSDLVLLGSGGYFVFERKNKKQEELSQILVSLAQEQRRVIVVEETNRGSLYRALTGRLHTDTEEGFFLPGSLWCRYRRDSGSVLVLPHRISGIYTTRLAGVNLSKTVIWSKNSKTWTERIPEALHFYEAGTRQALFLHDNKRLKEHSIQPDRSYYDCGANAQVGRYVEFLKARSRRKGGMPLDHP